MRKYVNGVVVPDLRDGYTEIVNMVRDQGNVAAPRGYKTYELEDFVFELTNPLDALPVGVGRSPNVAIGAAEALLLIGGISDPSLLISVSKAFRRFIDGGVLHGAYGPRVRPQLARAAERLERDPDSRQAIVTIWDPLYDSLDTRDVPCTLSFGFRIRDGKLNMSTTMRSQDVWLGLTYDAFVFTQLQATMANALGVPLGAYRHHVYSFHLYDRNADAVDQLHPYCVGDDDFLTGAVPGPDALEGFGYPSRGDDFKIPAGSAMSSYSARARCIHDVVELEAPPATASERWYDLVLRGYDRVTRAENFAR